MKFFKINSLLFFFLFSSLSFAQPKIPMSQMPRNLSADIKQKVQSLYAPNPTKRATAALQLSEFGAKANPAIPFLVSMLGDDVLIDPVDDYTHWWSSNYEIILKTSPNREAAKTLAILGEKAVDPLIKGLQDTDWKVRSKSAHVLGNIESYSAVDPLIKALKDDSWQVRKEAVAALGDIEDARSLQPLVQLLKDQSWQVRLEAVQAVSEFQDSKTVTQVISLLKDSNWQVREEAAETLGDIDDKSAVRPLIAALKDEHWRVRIEAG